MTKKKCAPDDSRADDDAPRWADGITDEERARARAMVGRDEPNPTQEELIGIGYERPTTDATTLRQVEAARRLIRRLRLKSPRLEDQHEQVLEAEAASEGQDTARYMADSIMPVAAWDAVPRLPADLSVAEIERRPLPATSLHGFPIVATKPRSQVTLEQRVHRAVRQILGGPSGASATKIQGGRRNEADNVDADAVEARPEEAPDALLELEAERRKAADVIAKLLSHATPAEGRLIAIVREHDDWTRADIARAPGISRAAVTQTFTGLKEKAAKIIQIASRIR